MPNTTPFQALVTCSQNHLQPEPMIIAERQKFHKVTLKQYQNILELLHRVTAELKFEGFLEALWVDLCVWINNLTEKMAFRKRIQRLQNSSGLSLHSNHAR